jgi:DICT domain-containing protein
MYILPLVWTAAAINPVFFAWLKSVNVSVSMWALSTSNVVRALKFKQTVVTLCHAAKTSFLGGAANQPPLQCNFVQFLPLLSHKYRQLCGLVADHSFLFPLLDIGVKSLTL